MHTVTLPGNPVGMLTANATGQALASFTAKSIPGGSKVMILNAGPGTTVIAQTGPFISGNGRYKLNAIEAGFRRVRCGDTRPSSTTRLRRRSPSW